MNDARVRVRYLDETVHRLFPSGDSGEMAAYSLLPHARLPRRLVRRRWWHGPLSRPVMVPAADGGSIEDHLGEVLGMPIRTVLHVRPARRANRKPILSAYGPDGLAAYVKIGDTERTAKLVGDEARALRLVADLPLKVVTAPTVLHHGSWRGLAVLAVSPLPVPRRHPRGTRFAGHMVRATVREIAELCPGERYAWHGDLTPWNMAPAPDGRMLVWDWERFATGVPLGFDAVHFFLHRALRRMRPALAARACLAQATGVLAPYGLSSAEARLTVLRYLIALADRHATDGHEPFGPPATWLSPLIDHAEPIL
ncbi:hypothetical protein C1I98_36740 [Spongiactinospora gelatinilytica]|uniref:Aminoglycoside phosphotransferase domain-containing protein n=1 Tax=Spongiactinospora gelatinilytica TaxID=2666298 RepID=A0A2W2F1U3_9ACTN|nr:hypothetical protein [Spongiactinospora gelatinilytica]PZG22285.1 hypothetical protein C1I98_36740 [Spongiactinospora gelatinilytica]